MREAGGRLGENGEDGALLQTSRNADAQVTEVRRRGRELLSEDRRRAQKRREKRRDSCRGDRARGLLRDEDGVAGSFHVEFIATSDWLHEAAPSSPPMKAPSMKSGSALFLQVVIVLVGIGILGLMLWEPHLEGRNAHATTFEIYFKDPFLAYVYVGSIPFFVALWRAFGLFEHVRRNGSFSPASLEALRSIKRCAMALIGFIAGAAVIILLFGDGEDRPAGIFMSGLALLGAGGIAAVAALSARILARALGRQA